MPDVLPLPLFFVSNKPVNMWGLRITYALVQVVPDLVRGLVEKTILRTCELASLLSPAVDGGVAGGLFAVMAPTEGRRTSQTQTQRRR